MLLINGLKNNPWFNLAAEEYFLRETPHECFILWENPACIVVGKHQNAIAEINLPYVIQHNIPVIRRLSGGGTVFHGPGNLNFTFISQAADSGKMVDFRKHATPVLEALLAWNIPAAFSPRNDLFIDGKKVSGNAEHIYAAKKRVLHHGTLLYKCNLSQLNEAIRTNPERFTDKAVNSVRSTVTNIADYLAEPPEMKAFMQHVFDFVVARMPENARVYTLTAEDEKRINELAETKYQSWDWNFGYSPRYSFQRNIQLENHSLVLVTVEVHKGVIENIETDLELLKQLKGLSHRPDVLKQFFTELGYADIADDLSLQFF